MQIRQSNVASDSGVAVMRSQLGSDVGRLRRVLYALTLALLIMTPEAGAQPSQPVVAAASDLQFALTAVAEAFESTSGNSVRLSFGSSGNFSRQIRQGAPFEVFFSADEAYVEDLWRAGLVRDQGSIYGEGRIVLLVPQGSPLAPDGTLADLAAALDDGRLKRIAIANPDHAPYGKRAEEALRHQGLWERLKGRLVLGENVSQAAQLATSGNADGGIVAYALALSPRITARARYALIPDAWHRPLRQRMVLTRRAGRVAELFYAFAVSNQGRTILRTYGFLVSGEATR